MKALEQIPRLAWCALAFAAPLCAAAEALDGKAILDAALKNQATLEGYMTTEKLADLQPGVEVLRTIYVRNGGEGGPRTERWEIASYSAGKRRAMPQVQIRNPAGVWDLFGGAVIRMPDDLREATPETVESAAELQRQVGSPKYAWTARSEVVDGRTFYRIEAALDRAAIDALRTIIKARFNDHRAELKQAKVPVSAIDDYVPARYVYRVDAAANFVVEVMAVSVSGKDMHGRRYLSVDTHPAMAPDAFTVPERREILLPKTDAEYAALRRTYLLADSKAASVSKNNPKPKDDK